MLFKDWSLYLDIAICNLHKKFRFLQVYLQVVALLHPYTLDTDQD